MRHMSVGMEVTGDNLKVVESEGGAGDEEEKVWKGR